MLDTLAYLAQRLDNDPALFTDPVIETTWIWAVKDALALFNHLSEKGEHQSNLWGRKRDVRAWMYIPQYAQEKLAEGTFSLHRLQADITVIGDLLDHELHHNVVVTLGMNMRTLSDKLNKTRGACARQYTDYPFTKNDKLQADAEDADWNMQKMG